MECIETSHFTAHIKRSARRKSATISVIEGAVEIAVPSALDIKQIEKLLLTKTPWVLEKIGKQQAILPAKARQFVSGEAYAYLGRNYRLKVNIGPTEPIKLTRGRLVFSLLRGNDNPAMVKRLLTQWYKTRAEIKLQAKAKRFAALLGVTYQRVGIKDYKSRWGNCTAKGEIDFNWLIMMAPNHIVDYVVVHELCHLIHFDHSPAFWQQVERVIINHTECRAWLKEYGAELSLD